LENNINLYFKIGLSKLSDLENFSD